MITATDPVRPALRAQLRELIAARRPGERLPSERDLCEQLGAARMTVRRAMDGLVGEGLAERRRGSGTYVASRPVVRALGLTSFSEDMRARGLEPGSRLVSFRTGPADRSIAGQLGVAVGTPVHIFTRVRLGSGEPVAVETTWVLVSATPGLGPDDLRGSLYEVLLRRYGIVPGTARVAIAPIVPDLRTRELLEIGPEHACLHMRMVDADPSGRPLMVAACVYRGDRYQLMAEITHSGAESRARR